MAFNQYSLMAETSPTTPSADYPSFKKSLTFSISPSATALSPLIISFYLFMIG